MDAVDPLLWSRGSWSLLCEDPVLWFMSRMAGVTLFKIGLATPCSSAVYLLCAAYFIWLSATEQETQDIRVRTWGERIK